MKRLILLTAFLASTAGSFFASSTAVAAADFTSSLGTSSMEAYQSQDYTCSTYSRGRTYRVNGWDDDMTSRNVVAVCIRSGGDRLECQSNVSCSRRYPNPPPPRGSYYNWGQGRDGYGYCYEWASNGSVLNGGQPVGNYLCERTRPSYFGWGRGQDGNTYCYQWTPDGLAMNGGAAVSNSYCR